MLLMQLLLIAARHCKGILGCPGVVGGQQQGQGCRQCPGCVVEEGLCWRSGPLSPGPGQTDSPPPGWDEGCLQGPGIAGTAGVCKVNEAPDLSHAGMRQQWTNSDERASIHKGPKP